VSAPDLVEVIAEALLSAELGRAFDRNEDMVAFKEDLEACRMDARAVLAALEEAGTVEWGMVWAGAEPNGVLVFDSEDEARETIKPAGLVSRLTLPWTAVQ